MINKPYKIAEITEEYIKFTNGFVITCFHDQDWCEWNYAQFDALDDIAREAIFVGNLDFEEVPGYGFKFGNKPYNMYFVPCYSSQNGYYSSDLDILLNGYKMLNIGCEMIYW